MKTIIHLLFFSTFSNILFSQINENNPFGSGNGNGKGEGVGIDSKKLGPNNQNRTKASFYYRVYLKNGKYGIFHDNDRKDTLLPAIYDKIHTTYDSYYNEERSDPLFVIEKDGKIGLFHCNKKQIVAEIKYISFEVLSNVYPRIIFLTDSLGSKNAFEYSSNNFESFLKNRSIEGVKKFSDTLYSFCENKKWGIVNIPSKKIILEPKYDFIRSQKPKNEPGYFVCINKKFGFINLNYQEIMPTIFDSLKVVSVKEIEKDDFLYLLDFYEQDTTFEMVFTGVIGNSKHLLRVGEMPTKENTFNCIKPFYISNSKPSKETMYIVQKNNEFALISKDKKVLIPFQKDSLYRLEIFKKDFTVDNIENYIFTKGKKYTLIQKVSSLELVKKYKGNYVISRVVSGIVLKNKQRQILLDTNLNEIFNGKFTSIYNVYSINEKNQSFAHLFCAKNSKLVQLQLEKGSIISIDADSVFLILNNESYIKKNNKFDLFPLNSKETPNYEYDYISKLKINKSNPSFYFTARKKDSIIQIKSNTAVFQHKIFSSENQYSTSLELGTGFVNALKNESDSALYDFAKSISPDFYTFEQFDFLKFEYCGYFNEISEYSLNYTVNSIYQALLSFKNKLKNSNALNSLELIEKELPVFSPQNFQEGKINLECTEASFKFKNGEEVISYKLGELMKTNHGIKSFTKPKETFN